MSGIITGAKSIGMFSKEPTSSTLPPYSGDVEQTIKYLMDKFTDMQTLVEGKADANRLKTLIQYSDEAIRIQAADIVLVGDVTIAQIIKEQNGTTNGALPISITRIIGDRIQTGTITSNNWSESAGTAINLNDGIILMGGSEAPAFYFEDGNLTITGTLTAGSVITNSVTIDGVTIGTIAEHAAAGLALQYALEVSGTTVLKGVIQPQDSGAIKIGTITWNTSTGALTGGTGLAMTEYGIIGAANGNTTFAINAATGDAVFAGTLSAATGSFYGDIETTGRMIATGAISHEGTTSAIHGWNDSNGAIGVSGRNDNAGGTGVHAQSVGGTGLYAVTLGGVAVSCNATSGIALAIQGRVTKSRTNGHVINLYNASTHALEFTYEFEFE